ncbi:GntR family transcriptional regulator [Arthrobacter sp. 35W]|uniref:GntR family transcriptional regulator n=1 Tax=Arthrobacter sp. 35W TaxID=1132441 RepID=UPI0018C9E2D4|nr:GntR family transcriptional regulator [Arthrobacter sp. 35W]
MSTVERNSPVPAWAQVMRDVRRRIEEGELKSGSRMPTENELATSYGVSRITIRQALADLASEGFVDRRQGTGTFVAQRAAPIQHDLQLTTHWRTRFADAGFDARSEQIETAPDAEVPHVLLRELEEAERPGTTVRLSRRHVVDGKAIGLTNSWVAVDRAPGIDAQPLVNGSLSQTLSEVYGVDTAKTDSFLEVGLASFAEAQLLNTYVDAPLFVVLSVSRNAENQVLELSRTIWISTQVRFHFLS